MPPFQLTDDLEQRELLRFTTAGSVDDGKSTLIGRLLYDCQAIQVDQLQSVEQASRRSGSAEVDLALVTDGLRAEREQKITIDVAYRPFATRRRRFIIADAPGHEQYTRNMITAASTAEAAVILLDAERGMTVQSRRHGFLAALMGIRQMAVAVNKMDLTGWSEACFRELSGEYGGYLEALGVQAVFIPISALLGDNVVQASTHMPWYGGPTLLEYLETVPIPRDALQRPFRMAVQYVQRPNREYRGYSGTIASGAVEVGAEVVVYPSRFHTRVTSITTPRGSVERAMAGDAVTLTLADDMDIGRGHLLSQPDAEPMELREFEATLIWMDETPTDSRQTYLMKHGTRLLRVRILQVLHRVDPASLERQEAAALHLNEIGRARLRVLQPVYADRYRDNPATGSFILIDPGSHQTSAAGLVEEPCAREPAGERHIVAQAGRVSMEARSRLLHQRPVTVWLTGLSGSGKSSIAYALEERLISMGHACAVLDGDNMRHGLNRDLGFTQEDRSENIRRVAEVARLMNEAGLIVITSFISPYAADREMAREIIGQERFVETFVDAPLSECERRDPKGLYAKARAGLIPDFTGISAPYEAPRQPDLRLDTVRHRIPQLVETVVETLRQRGAIPDA